MKVVLPLFSVLLLVAACGPARKVGTTKETISRSDTTPIAAAPPLATGVDSNRIIRQIYRKALDNKIDFKTFNARVRISYSGVEGSDDGTLYIRVQKDSAIWLSLRGPLGVEGFRILVSQDSVKVLDMLKKTYLERPIAYLRQFTGLPVNYTHLQDLIVGNAAFIDTNIISFRNTGNLSIVMDTPDYTTAATLDTNNYQLQRLEIYDIPTDDKRSCQINYGDYENTIGVPFSKLRDIAVACKSPMQLHVEFKQYSFNQPAPLLFSVPDKYKKL